MTDAITSASQLRLQVAAMEHMEACYEIINNAYKIENGDSGVGFKKEGELRFNDTKEVTEMIESGNMTVAIEIATDRVVGCIYSPTIFYEDGLPRLYFGPFASAKRGVGKILLQEVERIAKERKCVSLDINVINVRTDVFPWYVKNGYEVIGEKPYPKLHACTRDVHFIMMRKMVPQDDN